MPSPEINNLLKNEKNYNSLFLLLLYILTFFPLLDTGFTTNDDTLMGLVEPTELFNSTLNIAKTQGRIGFFLSYPIGFIPYAYQSEFYYQFTRLIAPVLLLLCLFFLLRRIYCNSIPSLLSVVLFFAFIQNSWQHNLMTSYPFMFHVIFCFLLLSMLSFISYIETGIIIYGLISSLLYFLSLCFELFILYFFIFIGFSFLYKDKLYHDKNTLIKQRVFCLFYRMAPIIFAILMYLIIYFCFRYSNPSTYSGNQIKITDWITVIKVVWQYSISSLPGYYFLFDLFSDQNSLYSSLKACYFFYNIHEIKVEWVIKSIIVFCMVFSILFGNNKHLNKQRLLIGSFISFICIFVPNILLGFTEKYQQWVISGSTAYVYTYYSFIGTVCFLSLILIFISNYLREYSKIKALVVFFISIGAAAFSLITDFHNSYITQDQVLSQSKWRAIDFFLLTPEFKSIENGSLIYAPSLFKHRGIVANLPAYWSAYIQKKTGKTVHVIERIPEDKSLIGGNKVYFLKYEQEPSADNQYFVFSQVNNIDGWYETGAIQESFVTVFSYSKNKLFTIVGFLSNGRSNSILPTYQEIFINNTLVENSTKSAFIQTIDLSAATCDFISIKINAKSALFNPDNIFASYYTTPPQLLGFKLSLISGFHGWEYHESHKFSWTNGDAELDIYNPTIQPAKIRLSFSMSTLRLPGVVSLHTSDGLVTSYNLEGGNIKNVEIDTILKPGHNKLFFETDIPDQLPGNGDTRKIAFGVGDFYLERL